MQERKDEYLMTEDQSHPKDKQQLSEFTSIHDKSNAVKHERNITEDNTLKQAIDFATKSSLMIQFNFASFWF